jgi:hypothetical protein
MRACFSGTVERMALCPPRLLRHRSAAAAAAALLLTLLGVGVVSALGAGSADALPTFEVTIAPNWLSPSDSPSSNYQSAWVFATSPSTPYRSPDSRRWVQRYLLLDPRFKDAEGRPGHDEWWFLIERYWPSSYQSATHGKWGREVNFHNVAGDAGPNGGVGWGFGNGSSALALDWLPSRPGPTIAVEPQPDARDMALPVPTRDRWHTYVVHFVAGRTDGTTPRAGAITVWVDGSDQPAIRRTGINTVQRALAPDGQRYTQRWMQLWEGDYTSGLQIPATTRLVLTRIGRTPAEALADRPVAVGTNLGGQYYSGVGANFGPPSITSIGSRTAGEALIPPSLLGPATDPC